MSQDDLTVWGIGTTRTMRVHWMLMELGLEYEYHPIQARSGETRSEEFLKLNPKHKIPVLRHGDLVLSESPAIIGYLAETFQTPEGFFVPSDPARRATLNEWCFFIMMELDCVSLYVIRRHGDLSEIYGEAPAAVAAAKAYFSDLAGAMIKKLPEGFEYLMPEGMSIADILMSTCILHARMCGIDLPDALLEFQQRVTRRPVYRRALERNFPERSIEALG